MRKFSVLFVMLIFWECVAFAEQGSEGAGVSTLSGQALPDSSNDLGQLKTQTDRRLAEVQTQLSAWKMVVANVTSAKSNVQSIVAPDPNIFDQATEAVKSNNVPLAKADLQQLVNAFTGVYGRGGPNLFSNQATDPDVSVFLADWQNKLNSLQNGNSATLQSALSVLYSGSQPKPQELSDLAAHLKSKMSPDIFMQNKNAVLGMLDGLLQQATIQRDKLAKESTDLTTKDDAIAAKMGKTKTEINQLAIELGLPLFCGTVLLMLIVPIVVQSFSRAAGSYEQVRAIFSSGILVEIITVLLLTMSILILGLSSKIEGPVLGTLLGGISGYVLNRFRGKDQRQRDDNRQTRHDSTDTQQDTIDANHGDLPD